MFKKRQIQIPPYFKDPSTATIQDMKLKLYAVKESPNQLKVQNSGYIYIPFPSDKTGLKQCFALFTPTEYKTVLPALH